MQDGLHIPVLCQEVLHYLCASEEGGVYLDGTFGGGGYSRAILEHNQRNIVYAIDQDFEAQKRAEVFEKDYPSRFFFLKGNFRHMAHLLQDNMHKKLDGVVLDIGVSSYQIDDPNRGFSFMKNGPLDMRMSGVGQSAADVVNEFSQDDLANIFFEFGEESHAKMIAKKIVQARLTKTINTTHDLASLIASIPVVYAQAKKRGVHPATKVFQALRIFINDELGALQDGLVSAVDLLKVGGRFVVVSFHSLEDRIVKNFMRAKSSPSQMASKYLPDVSNSFVAELNVVTKKAIVPSQEELLHNPRARSAKLRCAQKIEGALQ